MAAIEISMPVRISMTPIEVSIPVDIENSLLDGGWVTETEVLQDGSKIVTYYRGIELAQGYPLIHGILYYDPNGVITRADAYDNYTPGGTGNWNMRATEVVLGEDTATVKTGFYNRIQGWNWYRTVTEDLTIKHAYRIIAAWPEMEVLPIGYTVNMPYTNGSTSTTYDNPMILVAYEKVQKEGDPETTLNWVGIFMSQYAQISIPYDGREEEAATEEVAQTGLYYFGKSSGRYSLLELEDGDPIPYDDYDSIIHNEINVGDTRNGNPLVWWSHSAMRQYLNSDSATAGWWVPQHIGDCAPNNISSRRGFLASLEADDVAVLQKVRIRTPGENGDAEIFDRVWIPSPWEMYGVAGESASFDFNRYWQDVVGITVSHRDTAIEERATTQLTNPSTATSPVLRYDRNSSVTYGPMCVVGSTSTQSGRTYYKGQITSSPSAASNSAPMQICVAVG